MIKFFLKKIILPCLVAVAAFVIMDNNARFYHEPLAIIEEAKTVEKTNLNDNFGNKDIEIQQNLTVRLLNTQQKDKVLQLKNTTNQSQVTGQLYRQNQKILLRKSVGTMQIVGQKRDAIIVSLAVLFVGLMLSFIRWRASLFLFASLLLNLLYFVLALAFDIHFASVNALITFSCLALVFAVSSLGFVLGFTRQMFFTLLTTILTSLLTFLLTVSVLKITGDSGVHFENMNYVTQNPTLFFFVGAIISVLGAIMDGTGDIVAGLFGLYRQNQVNAINMTQKDYIKSGMEIGKEIIGTLTNVLFMIFMAETFPMTLLLLKNGNTWNYIAGTALNLGLLQTIISAIGIVLAVPITAVVTSFALRKEMINE
ncbi:YibE/F family protein [Lactococcus garvieae]|mgnify:CR=1 FL=1|jgi:uncharacterized membrane protein|uniref:YibE/F family protein n=1 Tax=Lactococcus garvieae TaxID=1363 RepID=UPI0009C04206|nr:YibE/F family protein [Lactococcus garvieae]